MTQYGIEKTRLSGNRNLYTAIVTTTVCSRSLKVTHSGEKKNI